MEIYDRTGNPQTLEWAKQFRGIDIERSEADTKFQARVLMERGPSLVSVYADTGDVLGPLKDAIVVFHCRDHPSQFLEATDSNGHCSISLDPGLYNVWIMHNKFESDTIFRFQIGDDITKLRAIFYLTGRVAPQEPEPDPPPEEPEEPTVTDKVKVYDRDNQEKDEAWAKAEYGVVHERAEVAPGQKVYRLIEWREKSGNSSLITQVLDEAGQPIDRQDVAFYWPDAPDPPDPPTSVTSFDWHHNFIHGPTNVNGDVGPGMGHGAYKGRGQCGPHEVWVRNLAVPSDITKCHGMIAGTPHDHMDQKFQLMTAGGEPNGGDKVLVLKERLEFGGVESSMLGLAYPASVSIDTRGDFQGPGVDDTLHPDGWEYDGETMALVEGCTDFGGDENREYSIAVFDMKTMKTIAGPESYPFTPVGNPRKRVIYVYELADAPDPTPDPDPPTVPGEIKLTVDIGPTLSDAINRILSNCCCGNTVVNNMLNK